MKLSSIASVIDSMAPKRYAQDWDNVGLLVGDAQTEVRRVLCCIDLTQEVLDEAIAAKAQMVLAYHPVIFKPISRVTASATPVVHRAIREKISVYSIHTAYDAAPGGTNDVLADVLGIEDPTPLESLEHDPQAKIVAFVPPEELAAVAEAAFATGAGRIGDYQNCAFFSHGLGSFCGGEGTNPTIGNAGAQETVEELRLEMVCPARRANDVVDAVRNVHSYEQPAIDVYPLISRDESIGMGRVGNLKRPVTQKSLITRIKKAIGTRRVMIAKAKTGQAASEKHRVQTAACGAGSCGSMYKAAAAAGATFFLTGEMRHHDLLAANAAGLTSVCLGHSNSERIAIRKLAERLDDMFPKVSVQMSETDRDPLEFV